MKKKILIEDIMPICKHKWHFMEKEIIGGDVLLDPTLDEWGLFHITPISKILAVFVCEKCGEVKRVEIKPKIK